MWTLESPEIYRNMAYWNEPTQQGILDTTLAVAGAGGAGYLTTIQAAHMGVQRFAVADPEDFEAVNANRVLGAHTGTYGRNKAEVLAEEILNINPGAEVRVFDEGINPGNVGDFVRGADVVMDATELSMPELGVMLCRAARLIEAPVLNAEYVGHGAQVTSFDPRSSWTFEHHMGIEGGEEAPLDKVAGQVVATDRFLSYVPPYADLSSLTALKEGAPTPSNMIGAGMAAQMAVAELLKHVRARINEKGLKPVFAPQVRWMDAYTGESGTTSHPRLSFYTNIAHTALRNQLGRKEPAAYSATERAARGDGRVSSVEDSTELGNQTI
jgi:tRNA threonylcarbamoyladenosine dehydratase